MTSRYTKLRVKNEEIVEESESSSDSDYDAGKSGKGKTHRPWWMGKDQKARIDYHPLRDNMSPPWKSIFIGFALLLGGIVFVTIGFVEVLMLPPWDHRSYPMLILGTIMFLPGSYTTFIFYKVHFQAAKGYHWDNIPGSEN